MAKAQTQTDKIISVPVSHQLHEQLRLEADREERSLSDTCRRLLRDALEVRSKQRRQPVAAAK